MAEPVINDFADFIIEKLELPSLAMVLGTMFIYVNEGGVLTLLPCAVFHGVAYWQYRKFISRRATATMLANQAEHLRYQSAYTMKAVLCKFGYVIHGPEGSSAFVDDKADIRAAKKSLVDGSQFDDDDFAVTEVFIKGWQGSPLTFFNQPPGTVRQSWDSAYKEQIMHEEKEPLPVTGVNKLVMDWGYRHGLMLTQAQVTDLIATLSEHRDET